MGNDRLAGCVVVHRYYKKVTQLIPEHLLKNQKKPVEVHAFSLKTGTKGIDQKSASSEPVEFCQTKVEMIETFTLVQ